MKVVIMTNKKITNPEERQRLLNFQSIELFIFVINLWKQH